MSDTPKSVRGKLVEAALESVSLDAPPMIRAKHAVDAILAALKEPSEGMLEAGSRAIQYLSGQSRPEKIAEVHRAMIQHIEDGGS